MRVKASAASEKVGKVELSKTSGRARAGMIVETRGGSGVDIDIGGKIEINWGLEGY